MKMDPPYFSVAKTNGRVVQCGVEIVFVVEPLSELDSFRWLTTAAPCGGGVLVIGELTPYCSTTSIPRNDFRSNI